MGYRRAAIASRVEDAQYGIEKAAGLAGEHPGIGKRRIVARRRELLAAMGIEIVDRKRDPRKGNAAIKARRMARMGCACEACGTAMPAKSMLHLHHVVFVHRGGTDDDDNLVLLCPNCHAKAHWLDRQLESEAERPTSGNALLLMMRKS